MSNTTWTEAKQNLSVGTLVDDKYRVVRIEEKARGDKRDAVIILRLSSAKETSITRKLIESVAARLSAGETLLKQQNQTKGGISYTIAVEACVVAALGRRIAYDAGARVFRQAKTKAKSAG